MHFRASRRPSAATPVDAKTVFPIATLLLLAQLPHLVHLPLWVSLSGATLVGLRLALLRYPNARPLKIVLSQLFVTALAMLSAVMIHGEFGYFIGRDPAVAFLFILVAAKFAEIRHTSDATLLLCLAAFLLLTQYFYSQTLLAAIATLPAVIALAYSLAVLRDPVNPATTTEQLTLVGKLLIQGVPMAALLFLLFPRLPGPLWSLPEDSMATTGLSDSMSPGSIGNLSRSDAVAFRVEFDGPPPDTSDLYWRGPVLTDFDGRNWTISETSYEATPAYRGPSNAILSYTVMLQPHKQRWLFALESAISLPTASDTSGTSQQAATGAALGRFLTDGQLIATKPVLQVLRYRQQSVIGTTIHTTHLPEDNTLFLAGRNLRTARFAHELRNSVSTDRAYVNRVLQHFSQEPFRYTLRPQLLGDAPVDEFLFDTRAGFCEHYAAAFVVMMRAAGIPSRVVTGYMGGTMNNDYMIVRQSDAHAWAEAFIDGAWRRYDPTAAVAPSRVERGLSAALPNESYVPGLARLNTGWLRQAQLRWDAINHEWQRLVVDFDDSAQNRLWQRIGLDKPVLWQLTLIVLMIAGLWCAVILGIKRSLPRSMPEDEKLWQRLCQLLARHGIDRQMAETPAKYLQRASLQWPDEARRLSQLERNFSALRFQPLSQAEALTLRHQIKRSMHRLGYRLLTHRFASVIKWALTSTNPRASR